MVTQGFNYYNLFHYDIKTQLLEFVLVEVACKLLILITVYKFFLLQVKFLIGTDYVVQSLTS